MKSLMLLIVLILTFQIFSAFGSGGGNRSLVKFTNDLYSQTYIDLERTYILGIFPCPGNASNCPFVHFNFVDVVDYKCGQSNEVYSSKLIKGVWDELIKAGTIKYLKK